MYVCVCVYVFVKQETWLSKLFLFCEMKVLKVKLLASPNDL